MARRDEIVYSEWIRSDLRIREMVGTSRDLVEEICHDMIPAAIEKIRQCLCYIELIGDGAPMNVARIVRVDPSGEPSSRDFDFSDIAIQLN